MYDNATKDKFVELRAKGHSFDKIAAQLGTSKSTLHRWADEREADSLRLQKTRQLNPAIPTTYNNPIQSRSIFHSPLFNHKAQIHPNSLECPV